MLTVPLSLNNSEISLETATSSQDGGLNTNESGHAQGNIQNDQSARTDSDIGNLCSNENVSSPSCNNVTKKELLLLHKQILSSIEFKRGKVVLMGAWES